MKGLEKYNKEIYINGVFAFYFFAVLAVFDIFLVFWKPSRNFPQ